MSANAITKLFEMILILVLGGQQPEPAATPAPDLRRYVDHDVPVYVEIDLGALPAASATVPELKKALAAAGNRDGATAWMSEHIGAQPAAVREAFTGIRRAGFWLLGFGEDAENFRCMLVIDRGSARDIIPSLLAGNQKIPKPDPNDRRRRRGGYRSISYAGVPIHGIRGQNGPGLWATEWQGKLAVATDRFALQSFILHCRSGTAPARKARPKEPGSILWAEADGPVILNHVLTMVNGHDRDEFAMASLFFDFPAWRAATLSLTKDRLELVAAIDPASRLTKVLASPAGPPALLSALPDDCDLAFVVSLKDPGELWAHAKGAFSEIMTMEGRPERQNRIEEEFRKATGIDIQKDIVDNITAAGFAVPVLKAERDLEQKFVLLGQARDAARAETALQKFIGQVMRGEGVTPMTVGTAKVWSSRDGKAAMVGNLAMLGPTPDGGGGVDHTIKAATTKSSELGAVLPKRFPGATSFAMFSPAVLLRSRDVGRLTAGLSFTDNRLRLQVDYSIAKAAAAFTEAVEAAVLQGKKAQAVSNLKQIAMAAQLYLNDYAKYPDGFEQMLKYAGGNRQIMVSPVSAKPYVFNRKIAGLQVGTIPDRNTTALAYDSPAGIEEHGGGHAVFLDGHVEWLEAARFKRVVGIP